MLCYAMLCYAMLCYAMICYDMYIYFLTGCYCVNDQCFAYKAFLEFTIASNDHAMVKSQRDMAFFEFFLENITVIENTHTRCLVQNSKTPHIKLNGESIWQKLTSDF